MPAGEPNKAELKQPHPSEVAKARPRASVMLSPQPHFGLATRPGSGCFSSALFGSPAGIAATLVRPRPWRRLASARNVRTGSGRTLRGPGPWPRLQRSPADGQPGRRGPDRRDRGMVVRHDPLRPLPVRRIRKATSEPDTRLTATDLRQNRITEEQQCEDAPQQRQNTEAKAYPHRFYRAHARHSPNRPYIIWFVSASRFNK